MIQTHEVIIFHYSLVCDKCKKQITPLSKKSELKFRAPVGTLFDGSKHYCPDCNKNFKS